MAAKREKPPAIYKKGPSYLFRIQYQDNGVTVRAAWRVGNVGEPIALAERNAKVVRTMVREGRVGEVPDFLAGRLKENLSAGNTVTVGEIAHDLFEAEELENPRATEEARSVYRNHLKQPLGSFDVAAVSPAFLRERVFEPMARKGLAQATLQNVRIVARKVFKFAIYRQLIERNPVDDIYKLPRAKKDHRPFVLPTDEEFVRLVNYLHGRPPTENTGGVGALELATLIISSRFIGGQRASDLHAWRWSDIDQETWKSCTVRRPKTERDEHGELVQRTVRVTHMINEDERDALKRWWEHEKKPKPKRDEHGKLTHDPLVFPTRTGKRAGEPKKGMGYASALRVAMTRALGLEVPETEVRTRTRKYKDGSTRKMNYEATVWRTVRKPKGREVTLLLGDEEYRPLNMHTMRRAYASGLAMAGWSRAKMRTAGGWATDAMPARYDLSAQHECAFRRWRSLVPPSRSVVSVHRDRLTGLPVGAKRRWKEFGGSVFGLDVLSAGWPAQREVVRAMQDAVADCVREGGIANVLVPVLRRELTSDDHGPGIVAVIEEFEQVLAFLVVQRSDCKVIDDEDINASEASQQASIGPVGARQA